MKYAATVNDQTFIIEINQDDEVIVDGKVYNIDFVKVGNGALHSLLVDNNSFEALVEEREGRWQVLMEGNLYAVQVADERAQRMAAKVGPTVPETGELLISAPMPGLVLTVLVKEGQDVEAGDTVVVLESMKMENELKVPRGGRVERVLVKVGDSVELKQTLIIII